MDELEKIITEGLKAVLPKIVDRLKKDLIYSIVEYTIEQREKNEKLDGRSIAKSLIKKIENDMKKNGN